MVRFRPRPPDQHRSFASDCDVFVCADSGTITPCALHLLQVALDLAHGHSTGVERQDLLVKACPSGLVLGDELGHKAAVAVSRYFYGQFAKVALEGFFALAVAGVTGRLGHSVVLGIPGSTVNNPLPSEFPMKSTL